MASTYLTRTIGTPTNAKKATFSAWIKKSNYYTPDVIFSATSGGSDYLKINFENFSHLYVYSPNSQIRLKSSRAFQDSTAWYHIFVAFDTTQAVASNRVKIYVNNIHITDFEIEFLPSLNADLPLGNNSYNFKIGEYGGTYFDGLMSHVNFIDGTAYAPTDFGEVDSATNIWKIKHSPIVTYGNNGFFILKNGNSVTDASSNSNNFTVSGGTLTKSEDSPSNNFTTMSLLKGVFPNSVFSKGNNELVTYARSNEASYDVNAHAMESGKYYMEAKAAATNVVGGIDGIFTIGIAETPAYHALLPLGKTPDSYGYYSDNGNITNNDTSSSYGATYGVGDIIGVALDLDNSTITFYKNGVSQGNTSIQSVSGNPYKTYMFALGCNNSSNTTTVTWQANFGNGYFGSTAVTSAGNNSSGIGIFEYDVPSGFTAVSTKGFNL